MDLKKLIAGLLAGKLGTKIFGRLGKRFGLTPEQVTTVLAVGIPIILKFWAERKRKKSMTIKGKVK